MAAGDSQVYGKHTENLLKGTNLVDWDNDTLKIALTTSSYTPDVDAHDFFDDVTNEVSVTGYTAGGQTVSTVTVSYDSANNRTEVDCADPEWTFSASVSPAYAVLYKDTGTDSTSPLVAYWELAGTAVSGTYTLTVDAEGLFQARATSQAA